jgi:hypothetical protein
MDINHYGEILARVLPKVKTKLQLSGLVVGVVIMMVAHFAKPGDTVAMLIAGSVGVSIVIFGQLFHFLGSFRPQDRPLVFLLTFAMFCVLVLALLAALTFRIQDKPSMVIRPYAPTSSEKDSASKIGSNTGIISSAAASTVKESALEAADKVIRLTLPDDDPKGDGNDIRSADYTYSETGGVPTLTGTFGYTQLSRSGRFPDGDFHSAVWWGSPWISLDVSNPSKQILFLTLIRIDVSQVTPINELILHVPNVEFALRPGNAKLQLLNEGWGKALNGLLDVAYVRPLQAHANQPVDQYAVVSKAQFKVPTLDDQVTIDIGSTLPPLSNWAKSDRNRGLGKEVDAELTLLGTFSYTSEKREKKVETFSTTIYTQINGGGNIGPFAEWNVSLPLAATSTSITLPTSECIAAGSAAAVAVRFTAERSARYKLTVSVESATGSILRSPLTVDVLVPRVEHVSKEHTKQFLKNKTQGCT